MDGGDWGNVIGVVLVLGVIFIAARHNGSGPNEGGFA